MLTKPELTTKKISEVSYHLSKHEAEGSLGPGPVYKNNMTTADGEDDLQILKDITSGYLSNHAAVHNAKPTGLAFIKSVKLRMFLFYRATELVNNFDDSYSSGAVWGGRYKLVTTESTMCLQRFFDLHADSLEMDNLIDTRHDPIPAYTEVEVLKRLDIDIATLPIRPDDVPASIDVCSGLDTMIDRSFKNTMMMLKRYINIKGVSSQNNCDILRSTNETKAAICIMKAVDRIMTIIQHMLIPLRQFVTWGDMGHTSQLCYPYDDPQFGAIPVASAIKPIQFGNNSSPAYFYMNGNKGNHIK
jgi:hypothetical protein